MIHGFLDLEFDGLDKFQKARIADMKRSILGRVLIEETRISSETKGRMNPIAGIIQPRITELNDLRTMYDSFSLNTTNITEILCHEKKLPKKMLTSQTCCEITL